MVANKPGLAIAELSARQALLFEQALGRGKNRHRAVHRARKAIRRLRSMLALGRPAFGDSLDTIDKRLKRLALSLSDLRDAHVAAATALSLVRGDDADAWREVARALDCRRDEMLAQALLKDPAFSTRRRRLAAIATEIAGLSWDKLSMHDVNQALDRSIRRVRKAATTACLTRRPGDIHRWRRRVRSLRLQLEGLQKAHAAADVHLGDHSNGKKVSARSLGKLSDKLGSCQDLQVLKSALRGIADLTLMSQLKRRMQQEHKLLQRDL